MNVRILSCAEQELAEAVDYYNDQRAGLGFELAAEVKFALGRITAFPEAWPPFSRRTRRLMLSRFPYGILYQVQTDGILLLAIMHLTCEPKRWHERLESTLGESGTPPAPPTPKG